MKSAATLLLLACVLPAQASDVAALVEKLGSPEARVQSEGYMALQRTKPPEALALIGKRITGFPIGGQNYGMHLLAMYPLDDVRPIYRRLLEQGSAFLKGASAANLFRSGDQGVLPALAAAISAATDQERSMLLGRLYGIDDARVAAAVRALVRSGSDADAIDQALWHLLTTGKGRDEATIRAAEAVLADAAANLRARASCAAYLLAMGEGKYATELQEQFAKDVNALPRLQRFLERAPRLPPELLDVLAERLREARTEYEVNWTSQILKKHAEQKAVTALRELLDHKVEGVRKAALEALCSIPGALKPELLKGMLAGRDPGAVLIAADTLRRMDDLSGLEPVLQLANKRGSKHQDVVRVLGKFRTRAAIPPLLDALGDSDVQVRREAFTALGRLLHDLFPYRRIDMATAGYTPEGAEGPRTQGLQALRAWWAQVKKT